MNKSKTIWLIVAAVVVIIVCVVLAGKYLNKPTGPVVDNGTAPTSTISVTTSTAGTGTAGNVTAQNGATGSPRVTVTMQKFYGGASYSFSYPESWKIYNTSPFSINNFSGAYAKNDTIPVGGAEIDIATTTLYSGRLSDIMGTELLSATNISTSTTIVDKISCTEANYTGAYVGGIASHNTAVYCLRGAGLWKIYFAYRNNDPSTPTLVNAFNSVLASFKLLP